VKPWFRQIDANRRETEILTKIRDDLLPRLLSGEIRIEVGEEVIIRAARER
jgi:hypothetical protein